MGRYFVEIEYDGTAYCGWQRQRNGISIQQVLEDCFSKKLSQNIKMTGCGRTDAGVHARQFFAHFDYNDILILDKLQYEMNKFLPDDIVIKSIHRVVDNAHARYSAIERYYCYYIQTRKSPFNRNYTLSYYQKLDLNKMNQAAQFLLSVSDFTSFTKLHSNAKNALCKLTECFWEERFDQLIFHIAANRFTRNMVRAIVGTMIDIGRNKLDLHDFISIVNFKNRSLARQSVDAQGLFLERVRYPEDIFIN